MSVTLREMTGEEFEDFRRQSLESEAALSGCVESLLYVADADPAARALYEKCGYELLRRTEHGRYMRKELRPPSP